MNIGFDAKRAFHNNTGLGNYSRTLIQSLAANYPEHEYYLFNPKASSMFMISQKNLHEVRPTFPASLLKSAWRSMWVTKDIRRNHIDLYHGLSHEIPVGINKTGSKSVVTIHDLIHERFPEQYSPLDVKIYTRKYRYACEHADSIIAVSKQTKQDLIDYYQVPAEKILVCYQSCDPMFSKSISHDEKEKIKSKYQLPEKYFLSVGSIIERKNLLNVCRTLLLNDKKDHLVVIGDGTKYKQKIKAFLEENDIQESVIFLSEKKQGRPYPEKHDFPGIYQNATAMLYPSTFEGFGIPVLEALYSRIPVITSNVSCLPEAGGDAAYYVDPLKPEEIAHAMNRINNDEALVKEMKEKGWRHAQNFDPARCAEAVMQIYESLVK